MNDRDASDSPIANLERAASRCFKLLDLDKAISLFNLKYAADVCLKSLVDSRRNIPLKKEYSANFRTARKRKVPSNFMQDISIELEDLAKALSPRGRFRRLELSSEAISALFGELPSGRLLILSEPLQGLRADSNRGRKIEQIEKMFREGTCKVTFASAKFSGLAAQLDYLNSLRTEPGLDFRHSLFTLEGDLPSSFTDLVSAKWRAPPNCNIAVKDVQNALTEADRLQLAKTDRLASLVVGASAESRISFWDWSARAPVFELICNVLDLAWPPENGIPQSTAKASDSSERTLLLDLLQATLDFVEARLAEKLAEGAIQTPFSVLGELTSTRNDLSILLGYILNLRFDASLLRAYRAIIDDYVAFWEDAVEQENLAIKDSESGSRSSLDAHSGEGDHGFRRMATT